MSDWHTIDFFTDEALVEDPYRVLRRAAGPSARCSRCRTSGWWPSTGYDEAWEIYRDTDDFSSCNSVDRPVRRRSPLPLEGDRRQRHRRRSSATSCRCTSTWSRWTRRTTPRAGDPHAAPHAEAAQGQREVHVAPRRPTARRVRRRRPLRVHRAPTPSPSPCSLVADVLGVPEDDHRAIPAGLRPDSAPSARSAPAPTAAPARTRWPGSTSGSPRTSRTAAASLTRTCSPSWRWPPTPTAACRR